MKAPRPAPRPAPCKPGFTLVELMVVMAVLSIFLVITAIVSRNAVDLHSATKARIIAERNSAAFMRQFGADLAQRVNHLDARIRIGKFVGNDGISLLTQRQGYTLREVAADRQVSLVSYRVKRHLLERAASGYGFGTMLERPAEKAGTLALELVPAEGPEDPDVQAFQVIAPGIIRLELSFLVREGKTWVLRAVPPQDQQQIQQVIATVAVLDPDRSRMLDERKFGLIAAEFPDAVDDELPLTKWAAVAPNLTRRLPQIARTALQQVRVYQGVFTLPNQNPLP
ncbi:MAG: prepilin-type N-terminal cleavage/methylation domain-containing protein [Verrucomicrobia bacterium]|nr:prepilin-type N-terminal cleavage/methylation domain-containing protein [Verrucomicrobiota bacterium]